jgi:hypothetical protein
MGGVPAPILLECCTKATLGSNPFAAGTLSWHSIRESRFNHQNLDFIFFVWGNHAFL